MTTLVNIKHKNAYDVYIGRASIFGNPFLIGRDGTRKQVVEKYREYFYNKLKDPIFAGKVSLLKGKILGCFCAPLSCHGDVIIEYLEGIKNEIKNDTKTTDITDFTK